MALTEFVAPAYLYRIDSFEIRRLIGSTGRRKAALFVGASRRHAATAHQQDTGE
jgi:hypothetical protein